MVIDPRVLVFAKTGWKWFSAASSFWLFEIICIYAVTCVVAGHPLGLHEFEAFVDYVFRYRF